MRINGIALAALVLAGFAIAALSRRERPSGCLLPVRDAGPEAMTCPPPHWDVVDQRLDESFPASDPPGGY